MWEDVQLTSDLHPSSRIYYGSFTSALNENFYIFGGKTSTGMKNDFWKFDPVNFSWSSLETINPPSVRQAFAYTSFLIDGDEYFAVFGGESRVGLKNDFYILFMSTLEWIKMENFGDEIEAYSYNTMEYYNGCFYMTSGYPSYEWYFRFYKYCLDEQAWVELTNDNETEENKGYHSSFIYNGYFYVLSGGFAGWFEPTIKIDLNGDDYLWTIDEKMPWFAIDSYGLALNGNILYVFGGFNIEYYSYSNELFSVDLETGNSYLLSELNISPEKRMHASMVAINGELYVFGGKTSEILYNDMWVFNVVKENWKEQSISGDVPSPRHSHAVDSDGDAMVLFGGEDVTGLKNDLFIYNSLKSYWKKLITKSEVYPRNTKGACLVLKFPLVYIYGGITDSGISGDLWQFDIGSLEYTKLSWLFPRSYSKCYIFDNLFYVIEGNQENDTGFHGYEIYNIELNSWDRSNYPYYYSYVDGLQIMLNNTYVKVGGQTWLLELSGEADVFQPNGSIYQYPYYFSYVYFSAFTYHRDRIYSFGGGLSQARFPVFLSGTYDFYYIDMKEICFEGACDPLCSKGTYKSDQGCIECKPGSYSEIMGSEKCNLCPIGTYNANTGGSSFRQCLPCPEGTFNDKPGSSICFECPAGLNCPAGSKKPYKIKITNDYSSIQPKMYISPNNSISFIYILTVIGFSLLLITITLLVFNLRTKLGLIDLYTDKHNYKLHKPMILTKNKIGGFFSLVFLVIAIIFVGSSIIEYKTNNIQETKALVPLIILEESVENFIANKLEATSTFVGYGGSCGVNNTCNEKIFINTTNLYGSSFKYSCEISENDACIVKVTCYDCELRGGASIFINSKEKLSLASEIYVNITSDSSIPNEISSIRNEIYASKNYVFIGSKASEFYYTLTPSLFRSQSSNWQGEITGYHVSTEEFPLPGSQSLDIDLPISAEFKIMIYLYKSNSGLFTDRIFKQSVLILISGILGSVFGIMGAIAGVMKFIEGQHLNITENFINKTNFSDIRNKRKLIQHVNFGRDNEKLKESKEKGSLDLEKSQVLV
ncbi:hypothetical protein SteCoe_19006 [Stentor coeruleus]|uniref:Tyrosine-protein kinase ephrin type A/B receptor-like domain-containing protein n=1 Tax=Stentor coeruleus TaxID=5963 RepID=A0A1R2BV41_9CILI|nr:hypothetical protein SteCoe_19006 [Stentor coeruleus]